MNQADTEFGAIAFTTLVLAIPAGGGTEEGGGRRRGKYARIALRF
ncbi:MAG TPA: hypothetical protein VK211_19375 [Kamptonema sp.]|nr:hypothetical protein [Kamptonema sp.]